MQADLSGTIQALYQFPIKGGAGNRLSQSVITEVGLQYDRQWLFVDEAGRFVTQRQIPHLVWVDAQASHNGLILDAPIKLSFLCRGHKLTATTLFQFKFGVTWSPQLTAVRRPRNG